LKPYDIQLERIKGMRQANGMVYLQFDAQVAPKPGSSEGEPCSLLTMTEEQARVLTALIKAQLLELDKKKAKSRR
jgi:hypothetical protein